MTIRRSLSLALCAATLVAGAAQAGPTRPGVITVSCFRGPLKEVIWDRPNPVFIDSLVAVGYDYSSATALAERICRDVDGVDNAEHIIAETKSAIRSEPQWAAPRTYPAKKR